MLAANLAKQNSTLAAQVEILELEKKKAEFAMKKEQNLCEISEIELEKTKQFREMELKNKQEMLDNAAKNQQEMFALEMQAKKRDLNLN